MPFFYLGDTAWTLFKRLDRDDAELYLSNRAAKGFTVIQAYVLRGLEVTNLDGHLPLVDRTRPSSTRASSATSTGSCVAPTSWAW